MVQTELDQLRTDPEGRHGELFRRPTGYKPNPATTLTPTRTEYLSSIPFPLLWDHSLSDTRDHSIHGYWSKPMYILPNENA